MSHQQRARVVAQWKASGQTAREFASAHGYKVASLYQWASDGRQRGVPDGFVELSRAAGIAVEAQGSSAVSPVIEVVLAGNRVVRVLGELDVALFAAVVRTLEAMC